MKNFVCWKREDARKIINPDVDAQPDAFFRAVHTETPIRQQDPKRQKTSIFSAEEVLTQFLEEPNFALVPVIGDSGAGKSHLVRWLTLRIKRDDSREVLFVPKAKTNLRDIVRALIERIPEAAQEQYLNMLQGTGTSTLTVNAQRSSVLNNIQTELKNDPGNPDAADKEMEEYLIKGLSDLLIDPYIREQHFLKCDGFAAELAAHIYERPEGYKPAQRRREFSLDDLPLEVESLMRAAGSTREFLQFIHGQPVEIRQKAVDIINRHTDAAIARCLNLSGDHLIQIMTEMRQNLKKSGKELILLIEDFARLQGLDRALLQSVLDQGDDEICALRTVFACTTGFYGSLENTVQTRATFVINMDNPLGKGRDAFNLYGMVARYMNAVRLGPEKLRQAWEIEKEREASFEIESACDECEHKVICHAAFGQEEGFGLYPFTRRATDVMAHRADEHVDQHFNVREFQKAVLRPVSQLTSELSGGRFPAKSLLRDLGGLKNFPPDEQNAIQHQSPNDADRHLTLIVLWGGETRAINLDKRIQEAFDLKPLSADVIAPEPPPGRPKPPVLNPRPDPKPREVDELSRWANKDTKMTQQLANELRPLVFDSVCGFINWDEIGCSKSMWAGTNGLFKQSSVIFENQSTKPKLGSQVSLKVPLKWENLDERTSTYLALAGLIESNRKGSWDIPDAHKRFVCLQECIRVWAENVTEQMLALKAGPKGWNPASASLELRVLGVLLSTPMEKGPNKLDLLELGLKPLGNQTAYASPDLEKLVTLIGQKEGILTRAIQEGAAATKGGQLGNFMNSSILVEAMKGFRGRDYRLMELADDGELRVPWHKEVYSLAKIVHSQLDNALQKEVELRLKWLERVETAFGEETDGKMISELFRKTVSDISKLGILGSGELQIRAQQFAQSKYAEAVRAVRNLKNEKKIRPWNVALGVRGTMAATDDLIKQADDVLGKAKNNVEARLEDGGYDLDAVKTALKQVREDLEEISSALDGGNHAQPN